MFIGTFGKKIIFQVSDLAVFTFQNATRESSGRWTTHEGLNSKPTPEFLGADLKKGTLEIHLSAALGVRPRKVLDLLARMAETGEVQYLVIGFRPFGKNPFRVTKVSEAWDTVLRHGELAKATVNLDLEEYPMEDTTEWKPPQFISGMNP